MASEGKLGSFLKEVSNWRWDEFCKAENDPSYSTNDSLIFTLVRACAMQKMDAIRLALNRLDGKLKTPVKVEYPKIFYLYPNATKTIDDPSIIAISETGVIEQIADDGGRVMTIPVGIKDDEVKIPARLMSDEYEEADIVSLPSMNLRETLTEMSDYPRSLPDDIVGLALQTEQWRRNQATKPDEIPFVKSVIAAHLLVMAQNRNLDALYEIFDQIDGKLVETIQVVGDDIYITNYSLLAPEGAYINDEGVLQLDATQAQDLWAMKLGKEIGNG